MRIIILILCLFSFSIHAKDYGNVTVSEVTSIYDADTFRVNIEGYPAIIGERVPVRVLGVDAPELRGESANQKRLKLEKPSNLLFRLYDLLRLSN